MRVSSRFMRVHISAPPAFLLLDWREAGWMSARDFFDFLAYVRPDLSLAQMKVSVLGLGRESEKEERKRKREYLCVRERDRQTDRQTDR